MQINKSELKRKYFEKKKLLDAIRDDATLNNYKILKEAKSIGKKIWGSRFSLRRLATDMDMPYTTVYRCLSLERASKKSWSLIKNKKISVFKLAMVCALKSKAFQDEIVDMVIKNNISTCKIKQIKINDIEDIKEERHRLAVEKGYSTTESALRNFFTWIKRGNLFMMMNTSTFTTENKALLKTNLLSLNKKIAAYCGKL